MTLRDGRTCSLYCRQVKTGWDKFGRVRTCVKCYFTQLWVARCPNLTHSPNLHSVFEPYLAWNSTTLQSGGKSASSRFNWHKVWTGVKCNFSWAHFQGWYVVGKLSFSRVQMWNFIRIGPQIKNLWLSIIPALRRSYQPRLGQPPRTCEPYFFLAALGQAIRCSKVLDLGSLNMQFQHDWPKDKQNYSSFNFFAWELRKISLDWALWCASRGIDNFSLPQLHQPYSLG